MEFDRLGGLRRSLEWRIEGRRHLCKLLNSAQILSPLLYMWLSYVYIACGCLSCNIRSIELFVNLYQSLDRSM